MTEHNIFQEIDDDLQRQKVEALWKNYGPFVIALAITIVLATAGMSAWKSWHIDRNQTASATLANLLNSKDSDSTKQMDALLGYAGNNPSLTQSVLAQFKAAALAIQSNHQDKAIEIYDSLSKNPHADNAFRQLADLRSIELQLGTGDVTTLAKRLEVLAADNAPWHFTAQEYQGYLALRAGDKSKARDIFSSIAQNASAPRTLSARANEILNAIAD